NHGGLCGGNTKLLENLESPGVIGLLFLEAVSAIDGAEVFGEAKAMQDINAHVRGLIAQDRHGIRGECIEGFDDAGIRPSGIQFVQLIMREKEGEASAALVLRGFGAKSAGDELRRAVTDVARDLA